MQTSLHQPQEANKCNLKLMYLRFFVQVERPKVSQGILGTMSLFIFDLFMITLEDQMLS